MRTPVVKDIQLGEVTLVDGDSLPEKALWWVQAMSLKSVQEVPTSMRCTEEECLGDKASIIFGAFNANGDLVGTVNVSNVRLVEAVGNLLKVKAVVLPYFPGVSDEMATIGALFSRLFSEPVELFNGNQLAILDVTEFKRLKILNEAVPKEARIKAVIERIEAAGFAEVLPDPDDESREIVRVRRSA